MLTGCHNQVRLAIYSENQNPNEKNGSSFINSEPTTVGTKMGRAAVQAAAFFVFVFSSACCCLLSLKIPSARDDGLLYSSAGGGCGGGSTAAVVVDAFLDPMCPNSRDSWPPLQQALRHYSPRVSLVVHPFPLPYHDNAFPACRALHIANKLNASTTYPLLELFFENQEMFYNAPTHNMSREAIVDDIVKLAAMAIGHSLLPAFRSGFSDPKTDNAARVSFKYGCSRGVTGTPFFFVNGFALPNPSSALNYSTWRSILDPLLGGG